MNKKLLYGTIEVVIAMLASIFVMRSSKKKVGPKEWQEPAKEKQEEKKI